MKKIETSIILLTLNGGERFSEVLKAVFNQTYKNYEVILIDSDSTDKTLEYANKYPIRIFKIKRSDFGHGKTRNMGAKLAKGDYIVYLTQDAIPANKNWLKNLLINFKDKNVSGVFGRQIPNKTANMLDIFNYKEDYPKTGRIISIENFQQNNVIFSDVNSAVRKSTLLKYPFPNNILVSEDLSWALKILKNKFKIIYEPLAAVIHSHPFNFKKTFKVTFDQGVSFSQIFQKNDSVYLMQNSKKRFINKIQYLIRNHKYSLIFISLLTDITKYLAVTLGKNYKILPIFILKRLSNYSNYWK